MRNETGLRLVPPATPRPPRFRARPSRALAVRLGADALGFVLHRGSSRFCGLKTAREIIKKVSRRVPTIGVWLDEPVEVVSHAAQFVGCDLVQTYDPTTARTLHALGFHVLPAIPIGDPTTGTVGWRHFCRSWAGRVVLDRSRPIPIRPITAFALDSTALRKLVLNLRKSLPFILAGSLNPENIRAALDGFRPSGVDVASGVESAPGWKDAERMARFIEEVRRWDAMGGSDGSAGSLFPRP